MRLLVGLGNPGSRYAMTRHNVGFMAVDATAQRYRFPSFHGKFKGSISEGTIGVFKVLALKPETFMNLSGESVAAAARFYKIAPGEIAVIHDDLDLAEGKLRVKRGGGSGGHNGLRSIDEHLGEDYWRIRIGIGHPGRRELVESYVLQNFQSEERQWVDPLLGAIGEAMPLLLNDDYSGFASKVALILNPPKHNPRPETLPPSRKRGGDQPDGEPQPSGPDGKKPQPEG
ncbi:MAG TPA: aminoacyl-tRNA hydrolase [Stellaceae bacterium]|nr:aminoacyl-tRNA hydrolase [Stellaceae bacterium]